MRTSRSPGFLAGRKIYILASCVLGAFLRLKQPCLTDAATSACAGRSCARRACIGHREQCRIDAGRRHAAVRKQNLDADVHLRSGQQLHQDGLLQGAPDERRELSALPAAPLPPPLCPCSARASIWDSCGCQPRPPPRGPRSVSAHPPCTHVTAAARLPCSPVIGEGCWGSDSMFCLERAPPAQGSLWCARSAAGTRLQRTTLC